MRTRVVALGQFSRGLLVIIREGRKSCLTTPHYIIDLFTKELPDYAGTVLVLKFKR